jgi:hypothetical protein
MSWQHATLPALSSQTTPLFSEQQNSSTGVPLPSTVTKHSSLQVHLFAPVPQLQYVSSGVTAVQHTPPSKTVTG